MLDSANQVDAWAAAPAGGVMGAVQSLVASFGYTMYME